MIAGSNCACPLCRLERDRWLVSQRACAPRATVRFSVVLPHLASFPSVLTLLTHLKACGQEPDGHRAADQIFMELLDRRKVCRRAQSTTFSFWHSFPRFT